MLVFVYGTLQRGHGNHRLLQSAEFVREATISGFRLHDSGFPVAEKTDDTHFVKGEIFRIDPAVHLRNLDSLEGEGSMYHREVHKTDDGEEVSLYVGHDDYWKFERMKQPWGVQEGDRVQHVWQSRYRTV